MATTDDPSQDDASSIDDTERVKEGVPSYQLDASGRQRPKGSRDIVSFPLEVGVHIVDFEPTFNPKDPILRFRGLAGPRQMPGREFFRMNGPLIARDLFSRHAAPAHEKFRKALRRETLDEILEQSERAFERMRASLPDPEIQDQFTHIAQHRRAQIERHHIARNLDWTNKFRTLPDSEIFGEGSPYSKLSEEQQQDVARRAFKTAAGVEPSDSVETEQQKLDDFFTQFGAEKVAIHERATNSGITQTAPWMDSMIPLAKIGFGSGEWLTGQLIAETTPPPEPTPPSDFRL